ncbi:MAG: hypothetical protein LBD45_03550, partial [Bacteroidales bacterium]|nr:hypothetical protein [Bacteroidales bacterium]
CLHSLEAQNFAARQLEYLAGLLKCPLPERSGTFSCPQVSTLPLRVEYDKAGLVGHLGFALFSDSPKNHSPAKALCDFQERLFLEVFLQGDDEKAKKLLNEYKVQIEQFSIPNMSFLKMLEQSLIFVKENGDTHNFTGDSTRWTSSWNSESRIVAVHFPANHDLISGMDKKEAELRFAAELQKFRCNGVSMPSLKGNLGNLQQLNRSNYVLRGDSLSVKARNSDVYLGVLYDRNYPEESVANLFNYPDQQRTKGLDLQISQIVYGGDSLNYRMGLYDFQCFMNTEHDVFTGIAKCSADTVEFSVIYKSRWYNCEHLLIVKTSPQILFDKTAPLKAFFYAFIPNDNVKNLYKEYVENKNHKIQIKIAK